MSGRWFRLAVVGAFALTLGWSSAMRCLAMEARAPVHRMCCEHEMGGCAGSSMQAVSCCQAPDNDDKVLASAIVRPGKPSVLAVSHPVADLFALTASRAWHPAGPLAASSPPPVLVGLSLRI